MSMSRYIRGIADAEKIEKAKQVKENMRFLGLEDEYPDKIDDICESNINIPNRKFTEDYKEIIEINVKEIPKEVTKIQFIISY